MDLFVLFLIIVWDYGRFCVGFFFNGFGVYLIGLLMVVLFEQLVFVDWLDLYLFVFNGDDGSDICVCFQVVVSVLYEVGGQLYDCVVVCICDVGIDVLFDLCGWGGGGMLQVLVMCLVLIQVNWLVYLGMFGVLWIDYVLVDVFVLLDVLVLVFSECIWCLLCVFQLLDNMCEVVMLLLCVVCGLLVQGVVLCCFNNSYKFILCSMQCLFVVLQGVLGSVLWLLFGLGNVDVWFCVVVCQVGLELVCLVFMLCLFYVEYLVWYQYVDLFFDIYFYNVYIIVFDVLWVGCFVLICLGIMFVVCVVGSFNYYLGFIWMNVVDDCVFIVMVIWFGNDVLVLQVLCVELVV